MSKSEYGFRGEKQSDPSHAILPSLAGQMANLNTISGDRGRLEGYLSQLKYLNRQIDQILSEIELSEEERSFIQNLLQAEDLLAQKRIKEQRLNILQRQLEVTENFLGQNSSETKSRKDLDEALIGILQNNLTNHDIPTVESASLESIQAVFYDPLGDDPESLEKLERARTYYRKKFVLLLHPDSRHENANAFLSVVFDRLVLQMANTDTDLVKTKAREVRDEIFSCISRLYRNVSDSRGILKLFDDICDSYDRSTNMDSNQENGFGIYTEFIIFVKQIINGSAALTVAEAAATIRLELAEVEKRVADRKRLLDSLRFFCSLSHDERGISMLGTMFIGSDIGPLLMQLEDLNLQISSIEARLEESIQVAYEKIEGDATNLALSAEAQSSIATIQAEAPKNAKELGDLLKQIFLNDPRLQQFKLQSETDLIGITESAQSWYYKNSSHGLVNEKLIFYSTNSESVPHKVEFFLSPYRTIYIVNDNLIQIYLDTSGYLKKNPGKYSPINYNSQSHIHIEPGINKTEKHIRPFDYLTSDADWDGIGESVQSRPQSENKKPFEFITFDSAYRQVSDFLLDKFGMQLPSIKVDTDFNLNAIVPVLASESAVSKEVQKRPDSVRSLHRFLFEKLTLMAPDCRTESIVEYRGLSKRRFEWCYSEPTTLLLSFDNDLKGSGTEFCISCAKNEHEYIRISQQDQTWLLQDEIRREQNWNRLIETGGYFSEDYNDIGYRDSRAQVITLESFMDRLEEYTKQYLGFELTLS